jgi:hypothetical protein
MEKENKKSASGWGGKREWAGQSGNCQMGRKPALPG